MNTSNITNYKPKDFAELLGVSVKTLQRWDRDGILKANLTPTNRRYYTYDQYLQFKWYKGHSNICKSFYKKSKRWSTKSSRVLKQFCNAKGIIVNNETLSPNEELVQDIISILHVFSCRLYGFRKYKNQRKEDEEIAKELQNGNKSNTRADTKDK